jgi:hypothetical protein
MADTWLPSLNTATSHKSFFFKKGSFIPLLKDKFEKKILYDTQNFWTNRLAGK